MTFGLFGHELIVDNFAGGGGASEGIEQALGRPVDLAINHDPAALATHAVNHPATEHSVADVWDIDPVAAVDGRPVGLAWFSPDCRHHSKAKGGRPVSKSVRGLAWVAARWAATVKPRAIIIENVEEFREWGPLMKNDKGDFMPDPKRKGETFRAFVRTLERHGYRVEWQTLRACDYGAPTIRKRFFLIARRDGLPIQWPKPSHMPPGSPALRLGKVKAWRTAAECIDWSIPCPSIFDREARGQRPLAANTLARIAKGVMRYVVESGDPFIVKCNHTARAGYYTAFRGQGINEPVQTITTAPGYAVVSPTLIQTGYGERDGQSPRALDIHKPLGTVVAGGGKHAVVSAFLAKHYTGVIGADVRTPMPTVTTTDHNAPVAVTLANLKGTGPTRGGSSVRDPVPTICAGGTHVAAVAAFLAPYYGSGSGTTGRAVSEPAPTITTRDRFQLITVTIAGEQYAIVDIGMRMLQPHELATAQGFPATYRFGDVAGKPIAKSIQVRLIGNSVCPPLARALVEANFSHERLLAQSSAA